MNEVNIMVNKPDVGSSKMLVAMVGIGVICAFLIVLTYESTLPVIKKNKAAALESAIFKVVPGMEKKVAFQWDDNNGFTPFEGEAEDQQLVYAGFNGNNEFVGIALEASGQGFADIIRILYGYDPETETVVGFYVLETKETPGLGDKIEKDQSFLANFDALDVQLDSGSGTLKNEVIPVKFGTKKNPWEVDGITGATISSRAIGNIISESSKVWVPRLYKQKELFKNYTVDLENTKI